MALFYGNTKLHGVDFRLLRINPGSFNEPITAHIETVSRSSDLRYLALSYVWGPETDRQTITVNGEIFSTTSNCASALRHIRHETNITTIWVDAVCINQASKEEKSSQVGLMRDIYKSATTVIVWLGNENDETLTVFSLLNQISELGRYDATSATSKTIGTPSSWMAVENLFKRDWFERIWIIQEVSLAKEVIIRCGHQELSWTAFNRALQWHLEDNKHIHRGIWPTDCHFMNAVQLRNEWAAHNFGNGTDNDLVSLLSAFSHWKATDRLDKVNALLGLSREHNTIDLKPDYTRTVIQAYSNVVKHVITRDRRLTILGQCQNPHIEKSIPSWVPDWTADAQYRRQISEPYRPKGDAQVMVASDGSILVPGSVRIPDSGYGTWQQDSNIREEMNFDASLDMLAESYFPTAATETEVPIFYCAQGPVPIPEETMRLKGVLVDVVRMVTNPLFRPKEDLDDPVFFLEWEEFALFQTTNGIVCPYGGTFEGRLESFWRTLTTDRIYLPRSNLRATNDCRQLFENWRANLIRNADPADAYVADTMENIDTTNIHALSRASYNSLANNNRINSDDPNMAQLLQEYNAWKESILLSDPPTELPSSEVTTANLDGTMRLFCFARKLARLGSGRLALVPEHTRPGDQVFIFYGASVPYILRELSGRFKCKGWGIDAQGKPYLRGAPMFKFIGEAYVHGIMDGEALDPPPIQRVSRLRRVEQSFSNPSGVPELENLRTTWVMKDVLDPLTEEQERLMTEWRERLKTREADIWFDSVTQESW